EWRGESGGVGLLRERRRRPGDAGERETEGTRKTARARIPAAAGAGFPRIQSVLPCHVNVLSAAAGETAQKGRAPMGLPVGFPTLGASRITPLYRAADSP